MSRTNWRFGELVALISIVINVWLISNYKLKYTLNLGTHKCDLYNIVINLFWHHIFLRTLFFATWKRVYSIVFVVGVLWISILIYFFLYLEIVR